MIRGTGIPPVNSSNQGHGQAAHATKYALARLKKEIKPFKLHWYPTLGSTNSKAAQLRREGKLYAPACVLTGRQTAGRGRGANVWHAPRGVMTATFVFPVIDHLHPHHIPLVAGLAVREACEELGAPGVGLKWPNDLWHADLKLAGLLCERVDGVDLVGVGLNVLLDVRGLPASLRPKVTSLCALSAAPLSMTLAAATVARRLAGLLLKAEEPVGVLLQRYAACLVLTGRSIRVQDGNERIDGICEGIDRFGRLLIRNDSGKNAVTSGNVSVTPPR